jgi:hypothetical protein
MLFRKMTCSTATLDLFEAATTVQSRVGSSVESADQAFAGLEGTLSLILREILSHRNLKAVNSR